MHQADLSNSTVAPYEKDASLDSATAILVDAMLFAVLTGPRRGPAAVEAATVPAKPAPAAAALMLA